MRHRYSGRHLTRTSAHHKAMRRNLAQSLFQFGQIETTLMKAKEIRPFVERLITLAREGSLHSRQRVISMLGDRAVIGVEEQEQYDVMSDAQRKRVLRARSGRRHRAGKVPAAYNKKKIPFVAKSVVHVLMEEVAPRFKDRPGGYTRIIPLSKRRIGDNSDLALLQLVGEEPERASPGRKTPGLRRQRIADRIRYLEGKAPKRKPRGGRGGKGPAADDAPAAQSAPKAEGAQPEADKS